MEGMMAEEIWKDDKVAVPALAVLSQSSGWPPDNEAFYHGIIPNLDYQLWSGVSHFLMIDKPDEFKRSRGCVSEETISSWFQLRRLSRTCHSRRWQLTDCPSHSG